MFSRVVPGPLVRWFARPYVAGYSLERALRIAGELRGDGLLTTLDLLGEDVTDPALVEATLRAYEGLIDSLERFRDAATRPSVSLKPSGFTTGDPEQARAPITALAQRAKERAVALTIDMEDHRWTDLTIDLSVDLFRRGYDVGTVLQTRLHRTEADLERIPAGMRLRLVIGIYPEAPGIALVRKRPMKERMVDHARRLVGRGVTVEFATHDIEFVERFAAEVAPMAHGRCEVQMLLGVPRSRLQRRLLDRGIPVRLYVPYADGKGRATAYLRRRMAESPNVVWLALRNLLPGRGDR